MTTQQEIIEDAVTYLSANGNNDLYETIFYWKEGAEENAKEAEENGWSLAGDWSECWDEVLDSIAHDLYLAQAFIYDSKTGEEIREATEEECRRYVRLIDNIEGHVDGAEFGLEGGVYLAE